MSWTSVSVARLWLRTPGFVSGSFQIGQNLRVHPHADAQIFLAHALEQLDTQHIGDGFNLFNQWQGSITEQDLFRASILDHRLALNQALLFKTVEQTRQGRPFDAHALRKLALGGRLGEPGEVQQDQPTRLRQAKIGKPTIQFGAPAPGEMSELHPETVFISQWHKETHDSN
ncbi:hypothetical protein ALQ88_03292 [Pseudomonas savastanoi]|nr:hypothetical protein ALQ88_03292 [Pseudomonas savastanoi]